MSRSYKVVFDIYHLHHLPQFEPVIDLLRDDPRFDIFLTTSSDILPKEQRQTSEVLESKQLPLILAEDEEDRARRIKALAPDVFICGWSRYPIEELIPGHTLAAMIFHGIGIKPSYWDDNHPRLNLRFVEGPFRQRQLREKGIVTDLALVGFAKLDPIFNGKGFNHDVLIRSLELDPRKKTILYAPTFYPSSIQCFGENLSGDTADYNLLIKLHTWVYHLSPKLFKGANHIRQRNLAEKMARKYPHVRLIGPEYYNIVPFLQLADVLLTEASSTIYEMIALDKPVIISRFYRLKLSHRLFPYRLYKRRLNAEMVTEAQKVCYQLDRPDNLRSLLEQALDGEDHFRDKRDIVKADMLYKLDGQVSQRIRDELLSRLTSGG